MPLYNINGQELHIKEDGVPNRQIALLIHGWSSSWYALSPLIEPLSRRFRTLTIDLPGYGQSPKFEGRTSIERYVDLLADLIEQVSDGPVILVGHSMGGMISLSLALKYPMLVERMVLICPTISGHLSTYINLVVSPITFLEQLGLARFISAVEGIVGGITDRIMRPASFAARTGITESDYIRLRNDARRPDQGLVRAECFRAMAEHDLSRRIHQIETPTQVIWGAEDNTVPLRDSGILADEWPEAELRILPRAGHWPHFEQPDAVERLVAAFLGLPLRSGDRFRPTEYDSNQLEAIANFLAHSDLGTNLTLTQRMRLAAHCQRRVCEPGETVVQVREMGTEMYVIQDGTVDVWSDPDNPGEWTPNVRRMATLRPGQLSGELNLFDEGERSADLIAGNSGAVLLAFPRQRLMALCEEDPTLGTRLLWNMGRALSYRMRFIQWQVRRERARAAAVGRETSDSQLTVYNMAQHRESVGEE